MCARMCTWVYVHMCACVYVCMCTCVCMRVCTVCVCAHVCVCVHYREPPHRVSSLTTVSSGRHVSIIPMSGRLGFIFNGRCVCYKMVGYEIVAPRSAFYF